MLHRSGNITEAMLTTGPLARTNLETWIASR